MLSFSLGKRELVLVLFVRLFNLRLFDFVCFLFLLVSGNYLIIWGVCDYGTPWTFLLPPFLYPIEIIFNMFSFS